MFKNRESGISLDDIETSVPRKPITVAAFNPMKAVYSYMFPEVRAYIQHLSPEAMPGLFQVTTEAAKIEELLAPLFATPLPIPATPEGKLDLDRIHEPIIDRIIEVYRDVVPGLQSFSWKYPGHGSSDGIFHLLVRLLTQGVKRINVLRGEYEGYGAQAENLGMEVVTHDPEDIDSVRPGYWFISNPSARDGNCLDIWLLPALLKRGNKVILDLAYVGLTSPAYPQQFDVSHPNIIGVVMSFSKPYGVFRLRLGGFIFTREPVATLFGTKWFKDIERLIQALILSERIGPEYLYRQYKPVQDAIVATLNQKYWLDLQSSDVLLLAHRPYLTDNADNLSISNRELIAPYLRGESYRFCLTPYFEEYERRDEVHGREVRDTLVSTLPHTPLKRRRAKLAEQRTSAAVPPAPDAPAESPTTTPATTGSEAEHQAIAGLSRSDLLNDIEGLVPESRQRVLTALNAALESGEIMFSPTNPVPEEHNHPAA